MYGYSYIGRCYEEHWIGNLPSKKNLKISVQK
jgi:hypothetical protein